MGFTAKLGPESRAYLATPRSKINARLDRLPHMSGYSERDFVGLSEVGHLFSNQIGSFIFCLLCDLWVLC